MLAIWVLCSGVRSSCLATSFRYSVLALLSQKGRGWRALWPRFMATAPATAPHRNTNNRAPTPASLGEIHKGLGAVLAITLWLIVREGDQHLVRVRGGRAVSHHGLGSRRRGRIGLFTRNQNRAEHCHRQQGCEHHPAPESKIPERRPK